MKELLQRSKYFLRRYPELEGWLNYKPVYEERYERFLMQLVKTDDGEIMLDNGCGNGRFSLAMAGEGAQVVSLDINKKMIETVNERRRRQGLVDKINPIRGDIQSLPFRDEVFDKVVVVHNLWYIPEYELAVMEMLRVVRAGGEIIADQTNLLYPPFLLGKIVGMIQKRPVALCRTAKEFLRPFAKHPIQVFSIEATSFCKSLLLLTRPLNKLTELFLSLGEIDFHIMPELRPLALRFTIKCVKLGSLEYSKPSSPAALIVSHRTIPTNWRKIVIDFRNKLYELLNHYTTRGTWFKKNEMLSEV